MRGAMTAPEQMKVSVLISAASLYAVAAVPLTMGCATFSPSTSSSCGEGESADCAQPNDPVAAAIAAITNAVRVAKLIFMAVLLPRADVTVRAPQTGVP